MAQPRDELGDLETRKLAAFAGLGALRDLDLDLVARAEIFGGDAKAARSDLLDIAVGAVAIGIGAIAFARFAAFARHRLGADAVHRARQRLLRLGRPCAERHPRGAATLADFGDRLAAVEPAALRRVCDTTEGRPSGTEWVCTCKSRW